MNAWGAEGLSRRALLRGGLLAGVATLVLEATTSIAQAPAPQPVRPVGGNGQAPTPLAHAVRVAEKHWTKPGATLEDFNRDSSACGLEARRGVNVGIPVNKRAYRYCMRDRGYRQVEGGEWVGLRD